MTRSKSYSWHFPGTSTEQGKWVRTWEVQAPPYVSVLPFTYDYSATESWYDSRGYPYYPVSGGPNLNAAHTINIAYDSLASAAQDQSQWANNLLEARESFDGLMGRLGQLTTFARALRKGHFGDAAKALGVANPMGRHRGAPFKDHSSFPRQPPDPKGRGSSSVGTAKDFGDAWLEYHFGWEPMVQDMGSAMKAFGADFGSHRLHRNASSDFDSDTVFRGTGNFAGSISHAHIHTKIKVKLGADFKIDNPNLFLANQLGFVNPLAVAWEAIPYSFVVDWFANVGQCLNAFSDFVGLSVTRAYTTVSQESIQVETNVDVQVHPAYFATYGGVGKRFNVHRIGGLSGPTLELKPFKGFSYARGATAVSLLLQHL